MNIDKWESTWMKTLFLGLLVVGSVVIFVLGVMVGSNVKIPEVQREEDTARTTAGFEEYSAGFREPNREEVALPEKEEMTVKSEEMTFYETLGESERRESATAKRTATPPATTGKVLGIREDKGTPSEVPPPAEGGSSAAAPAGTLQPADTQKEPSRPVFADSGRFSIQILASSNRQEAQKIADKLAEKGYKTYLVPKDTSKGRLFAVRIGKVATREEANQVRTEIKQSTRYKDAFLVAE